MKSQKCSTFEVEGFCGSHHGVSERKKYRSGGNGQKKVMKKLEEEVARKGLKLSVTENVLWLPGECAASMQ